MPFERSRSVITEPGITKINLATGPQAITGSTRMQATTIETYVVAAIVETAVGRALGTDARQGARWPGSGFAADGNEGGGAATGVAAKLREFGAVLDGARAALPALAALTDIESAAYAAGRFSTYYAEKGLITVFIDSTERSPTFRLYPLDTVNEPQRKCWIQVWTKAGSAGGGLAGLPGTAVPRAGGGVVPGAVRDQGRGPVPEAGGPREPEEGGRRPGRTLRLLAVEGEPGAARAEEGGRMRPRGHEPGGNGVRARRRRPSSKCCGWPARAARTRPSCWSRTGPPRISRSSRRASGAAGRARAAGSWSCRFTCGRRAIRSVSASRWPPRCSSTPTRRRSWPSWARSSATP